MSTHFFLTMQLLAFVAHDQINKPNFPYDLLVVLLSPMITSLHGSSLASYSIYHLNHMRERERERERVCSIVNGFCITILSIFRFPFCNHDPKTLLKRHSNQVNQRDREKVWIIIMYFFLYVAFKENFDLQIKKKKKKKKKKKGKKKKKKRIL